MYKCIKEFVLEKCDNNGFTIDGSYGVIEEETIWDFPEDKNYRFIGGEIRLESHENEFDWIEITKDTLNEHFKEIKGGIINENRR